MENGNQEPRRLADAKLTEDMLEDHLPTLSKIVEHSRKSSSDENAPPTGRFLKECVTVEVWQEADGSESIVVVGDSKLESLVLKGVLHDGIYALAHRGDPAWAPKQ
ncbi:MAG TPA: hypothetical protein VEV82_01025 [Actinomycetota bacterium]|nr:hypothetical protein [Actinomycetota bacterium]